MKVLIFDTKWSQFLKYLPYEIKFAYSEDEVYEITYKEKFDFYIFDFEEGYRALSNLRESGDDTIAIFLSNIETFFAQKKAYKIANEFFKKRCTYIEEVKIKIDYFIKKEFGFENVIKYNNIFFYPSLHSVYVNNQKIELTPLENELLVLFFKNKNKYLSKDVIMDTFEISEGSLKVKISQLRKLGFDILNTRGLVYKLEEKQ